jgi:hypothetical protein
MKIIIKETQFELLSDLLKESVGGPILRVLQRMKGSSVPVKLIDGLETFASKGPIKLKDGRKVKFKKGDVLLTQYMGGALDPEDAAKVVQVIFKNTDDKELINVIASNMVTKDSKFVADVKAGNIDLVTMYGKKQAEAIKKLISTTGKVSSLGSKVSKVVDENTNRASISDSLSKLISDKKLDYKATSTDDLITALLQGKLSNSDKFITLQYFFKGMDEIDTTSLQTIARELKKIGNTSYNLAFGGERRNAIEGLKIGDINKFDQAVIDVTKRLKDNFGIVKSKILAKEIVKPSNAESFVMGFKTQGGVRAAATVMFKKLVRRFNQNYPDATPEQKKIFWSWFTGAPSNLPMVIRLIKQFGWRGLAQVGLSITGSFAKKWFNIWGALTVIESLRDYIRNYFSGDTPISDSYVSGFFKILLSNAIENIYDRSQLKYLSPLASIITFISYYVGQPQGITRSAEDWDEFLYGVQTRILRDNPDTNINMNDLSIEGNTVIDGEEGSTSSNTTRIQNNIPISSDTTVVPTVRLGSGVPTTN